MAIVPSFGAEILAKPPIKLPMGVRIAETITTSLFIVKDLI